VIEFHPTHVQLDVLSLLYGPGGGNVVVRLTEKDLSEFLLEARDVLIWDHELHAQLVELESVGLLRSRGFDLDGIRVSLWELQPLAREYVRAMAEQEDEEDPDS
jgi:hypothetical protein